MGRTGSPEKVAVTDVECKDLVLKPDNSVPVTNTTPIGVPPEFNKLTASSGTFLIQKGQLNKLRLRPQIQNEHAESSRGVIGTVTSTNIMGQFFKTSQDNINGLNVAMRSAEAEVFDDFESYANDAALQAAWIETDAGDPAELETVVVYEGTQSMYLPGDATTGDEWYREFATTDFTGYTGTFHMQASRAYSTLKLRIYVYDSAGNTNSAPILQTGINVWEFFEFDINSLTQDGGTPADISDITRIGFRLEDRRNNSSLYIDEMISVPGPGSIHLKLWDMGTSLPTSGATSIDDGTQYENLGDFGISGTQVSEIEVGLFGGFRTYHIDEFVAGVALEIPGNELLNVDHYYALTFNYIDTNVDIYGPNAAWDDYYVSGYSFSAPDEATAITATGANEDLMFIIYSTQGVYVNKFQQFSNAEPNGGTSTSIYIEDKNMKRTDTIMSGSKGRETADEDFQLPYFLEKGGKFEQEYNDDLTDNVTEMVITLQYYHDPNEPNG